MVELKGRVACEISSADELVLTELMFGGIFNESTVDQVVALLSCLVWQEKLKSMAKLPEELAGIYSQLREVARRVGKVQVECKVAHATVLTFLSSQILVGYMVESFLY